MARTKKQEVLLINGVFLAKGVPDKLIRIAEQIGQIKELPEETRLQLISLEEYAKMKN